MKKAKILAVGLGLGLVALLAAACGGDDNDASPITSTGSTGSVGQVQEQVAASLAAGASLQSIGSQAGIMVTGEGTITLEPDLALLNLGVETTGATVAIARGEAAAAMDAIVTALRAKGVEDRDIQTRSFNIFPIYESQEVLSSGGIRTRQSVIIGYRVNNSTSVKLRDLDEVGTIIDDVAEAGGDATRINGISFTVEDLKRLDTQLREQAVGDALAKAQQFADLAGVSLGRLVFITEINRGTPVTRDFAERGLVAFAQAAPATPIGGGELEVRMSVQAGFEIQ